MSDKPLHKANIWYRKTKEGKLRVVSASFWNPDGSDEPILEGMVDEDYDDKDEIRAAIRELASWGDDPDPLIEVSFTKERA
jgi:hypothetical protein